MINIHHYFKRSNWRQRLFFIIFCAVLAAPALTYAVQVSVPSAPATGYGLVSTSTGNYIATTTGVVTCTGSATCGSGSYVFGNALTITASGGSSVSTIATTSSIAVPQLAYFTGASPTVLGGVSTSSLLATGVLSLSNTAAIIGSAGATLTVTGGSNGQVLGWAAGAPTWLATTTFATSSSAGGWGFSLAAGVQTLNIPRQDGTQVLGLLNSTDWTTFNSKQAAGNYITDLAGGDVTASGPGSVAATIVANAVTYAKFQTVAANSVVGNNTGATANAGAVATSTFFGQPTAGFILGFVNGKWVGVATTTFNSPLTYTNGAVGCSSCNTSNATVSSIATNNGITGGTITTTGTIGLAAQNANTVLANVTGASGVPTGLATSSLFAAGTAGQVLTYTSAGTYVPSATTTFSAPLSYSGSTGAVSCASCLTANQSITLSGAITGTGSTAITTAFGSTATANSVLANITGGAAVPSFTATSSLFTGTAGQQAYFSSTGGLIGTSSLFSATNSYVGVGSTTPWGLLSVNPTGGIGPSFVVGSSTNATSTQFIVNNNGRVGIGTSSPFADFSLMANAFAFTTVPTTVFAIGSTTAAFATTTLFSIGNTGTITTQLGNALVLSGGAGASLSAYAPPSNCSNQASQGISATGGSFNCASINNAWWSGAQLTIGNGGTGQTSLTTSQLLYGPGTTANGVQSVATSSPTFNGGLTTSGTAGAWVGGSSYAVSLANVNANSLLGCSGGAACTPTSVATSSLFTGTAGQNLYFSGTNTLIGTSSLFINTNSFIGVGTTTPWALLSINPTAGQNPSFAIGSSTGITYFAINAAGGIQLSASQPATTTTIVLDWKNTPPQVEYRIGASATTITLVNATTSQYWGSRKIVWVCNPGGTAGAVTWAGVEWIGTAPTQTTAANQCDEYGFDITLGTSTTVYKVAGQAATGFQ